MDVVFVKVLFFGCSKSLFLRREQRRLNMPCCKKAAKKKVAKKVVKKAAKKKVAKKKK